MGSFTCKLPQPGRKDLETRCLSTKMVVAAQSPFLALLQYKLLSLPESVCLSQHKPVFSARIRISLGRSCLLLCACATPLIVRTSWFKLLNFPTTPVIYTNK